MRTSVFLILALIFAYGNASSFKSGVTNMMKATTEATRAGDAVDKVE